MEKNLIRILLVEDNEDDAVYIRYLLRKNTWNQYEVIWAKNFDEGLARLLEQQHDVGLFDYRLGEKNGIDLLREAYAHDCRAPIILLTGSESPEIDMEASSAGAADYLCKTSLDTGRLERSIRYSLRHAATLQALRESQERFELFMKHVPCAVCIKGEDGRYLYVNDFYERMFDRSFRDWIGRTDREIWPESVSESMLQNDREVLEALRPIQTLEAIPRKDQGDTYWLASKFPMLAERGPRMLGVAAIDVTERVNAEEALKRTTQLLNGVLAHLPVVVGRVDEAGIVREWRGHGTASIGLKDENLVGSNIFEAYPEIAGPIQKSLAGESTNFIWSIEREGRLHHFDHYFFFDQDRGKGAIGFGINITDRIKAEEIIKQQSQMLAGILTNLPVIAGRMDERGVVTEIQGAGLSHFDLLPQDVVGRNLLDELPQFRDQLQRALKGGSVSFALEGLHRDQAWHLDNYLFFDAARGKGAIFFCRDVTEQKMLEKELLEISNQEQQRIGRDLHDDLGQVLTGIGLLSTALRDRLKGEKRPEADQAQGIAKLVQEAISQTRALARGLAPVQLENNGLQFALEDLAYSVQEMHKVDCQFLSNSAAEIQDHAVALHLYRIAQEAITNAIRHGQARHITIRLHLSEDKNVLSISDDGCGFRMNRQKPRSMGLRIMNYRAGMIGGSLRIASKPKQGTAVTCTFQNLAQSNDEKKED